MLVLKNAIDEGSCLFSVQATTMEQVLREGVDFLVQTGHLPESLSASVLSGLLSREQTAPTAIGSACAIPHYYDDRISESRMVFMRLRHPLNLAHPTGWPHDLYSCWWGQIGVRLSTSIRWPPSLD